MGKLRLERMTLRNFKGVAKYTFAPGGNDAAVYGDNATGKTTLADAFSWLMFDKDFAGRADFEIKTLGPTGEAVHGLDHEVEADLLLADGGSRKLRKVYREHWPKKRGQADRTFAGHITDHFVDEVPLQKKEYAAAVAELATEDVMRLLTDPVHFPERLHWQRRREVLLEASGDVSDADVIASTDALADLPELLGERTVEDHRKVVAAKRTKINQELNKLPTRIDEATQALPEVEAGKGDLEAQLEQLKGEKAEADERRAELASGGAVAELTAAVATGNAELLNIRTRARQASEEELAALRQELTAAEGKVRDADAALAGLAGKVKAARLTRAEMGAEMEEQRAEWAAVDAGKFTHTEPDTCVYCGTKLSTEKVKATLDAAVAAFNQVKSDELLAIDEAGLAVKAKETKLLKLVVELEVAAAKAEEEAEALRTAQVAASAALEAAEDAAPEPEEGDDYKAKLAEVAAHEAAVADHHESSAAAVAAAAAEAEELGRRAAGLVSQLALAKQRAGVEARIKDLKRQEQRLAAEYEEMERQLYLTEEFVRRKVAMLTERINARFSIARFKLFSELVGGGVEECCEVSYQEDPEAALVSYRDLNHGGKVLVGLDVIRTLQEHYGFAPPVWVDQGESVTTLPELPCQVLRLVVSEDDKELRIYQAQTTAGAAAQPREV